MLKTRIITALILIPLVVWATIFLNSFWFGFILSLFISASLWEWRKLFYILDDIYLPYFILISLWMLGWVWWEYLTTGLLLQSLWDYEDFGLAIPFVTIFWLIAPLIVLNYQKDPFYNDDPTESGWLLKFLSYFDLGSEGTWWTLLLGNILLWGMGIILWKLQTNPYYLLLLFLIVWSADIGAYFFGKKFGEHKLASNVSPGKTWEGAIGGLIAGITTTIITLYCFRVFLDIEVFQISPLLEVKLVLLSSVTVIFSIIGDLFISVIKRNADVEDTGTLFPGHGGLLDRVDSLMAGSVGFIQCGSILGVFY